MDLYMSGGLVLLVAMWITLIVLTVYNMRNSEEARIHKRLKNLKFGAAKDEKIDILIKEKRKDFAWLNDLLAGLNWVKAFNNTIRQANVSGSPGLYLMISLVMGGAGYLSVFIACRNVVAAAAVGAIIGYIPFFHVNRKKKARMGRFEEQLPDALDLIARSLRAGLSFPSGMGMVAHEFPDPMGPEFKKCMDEIAFGIATTDALRNLGNRVDCPDLKFFIISVIIQKDTGGNLAEIIENVAKLLRERFKLMGRVRTLSAEGKFSALILILLPFVIGGIIFMLNPEYMKVFWTEPLGQSLALGGMGNMAVGVMVIRKMVQIKV